MRRHADRHGLRRMPHAEDTVSGELGTTTVHDPRRALDEPIEATSRRRGLLAAIEHVATDPDLEEVLHGILESARTLTGARAAALQIPGDSAPGTLVHAFTSGVQAAAITNLPLDAGLLGYLLSHPEPLRLDDLSSHSAARGSTVQHPPGTSFLWVPVGVRGTIVGVLHLADADRGCFSASDEEVVVALASAAGLAIQNALLHDEARRRERWQAVSTQITRYLLSDDVPDPRPDDQWRRLLELAMRSAQAQGGAMCAVDPLDRDTVEVVATVGMLDGWAHRRVDRAGSLTEVVLAAEGPVTFDDTSTDPRIAAAAQRVPEMQRAVAIRLIDAQGQPARIMLLARAFGHAPFGPVECDMIAGFADHVATALALQHARGERAAARRAENSERLAHHLNDEVMTGLMRLSLDLAGLAGQIPMTLSEQVLDHIDTLDRLIRGIRRTVYSLDTSPETRPEP